MAPTECEYSASALGFMICVMSERLVLLCARSDDDISNLSRVCQLKQQLLSGRLT